MVIKKIEKNINESKKLKYVKIKFIKDKERQLLENIKKFGDIDIKLLKIKFYIIK